MVMEQALMVKLGRIISGKKGKFRLYAERFGR